MSVIRVVVMFGWGRSYVDTHGVPLAPGFGSSVPRLVSDRVDAATWSTAEAAEPWAMLVGGSYEVSDGERVRIVRSNFERSTENLRFFRGVTKADELDLLRLRRSIDAERVVIRELEGLVSDLLQLAERAKGALDRSVNVRRERGL